MATTPSQEAWEHLVNGVLLPGFSGTKLPRWLPDFPGLAGLVLFGQNTPDLTTTRALTAALHTRAPELVLAIDEEGGDVTRLQAATGSDLPSVRALGVVDDVDLTHLAGRRLGAVLRICGIDLDHAPVLDIASEPANPVIGLRSFADTPQAVARHAVAFAEGLATEGVAACGKHVPGHGDTAVDSHLALPVLDLSLEELEARELVPFASAIDAGIPALMTGHLVLPAWGRAPVSINPRAHEWLRDRGFAGVVVTDALDMRAVSADLGIGEAAVRAVEAGADLLCLGNPVQWTYRGAGGDTHVGGDGLATNDDDGGVRPAPGDDAPLREAHRALVEAVRSGRVSIQRLAESVARVDRLRDWLRQRRDHLAPPDGTGGDPPAELAVLGAQVAARAVTARGDVTLRPGDVIVDLRRRVDHAAGSRSAAFVGTIAEALGLTVLDSLDEIADLALTCPTARARAAIVTREDTAVVQDALRRYPDVVVLHTGEPALAPELGNVVLALGASRACATAVAALCRPTTHPTRPEDPR